MIEKELPLNAFATLMLIRCEYIEGPNKLTEAGRGGKTADEWRERLTIS